MTSLAKRATAHFNGTWHGSYGSAPSPGHSRHDRGLTFKDEPGAPDGLLVNTFNGANPLAVKDELRKAGILPAWAPDSGAAAWRVTGTYEYADEGGAVLYRTVRREKHGQPKQFVAQRPDSKGGWISKIGDSRRVLCRLPELLAADPAETVYFVEGERKADKLASWGLVATAVAFGCRGWRNDYAKALAGRTVAILPDNDDEGRKFAKTVWSAIEAAGGTAHILELPGLPEKGDMIDWTGTADELRELTGKALDPPVAALPLIDLAHWTRQPPMREFAWGDWIPLRQTTMLTGKGGVGKSLLAQMLCTCIALGRPLLGMETRQSNSLYITAEDDADELWRRQWAICEALRVPLTAIAGKLHLVSLCGETDTALATFDANLKLQATERWRQVLATAEAHDIRFAAFDNATE
jgi:hypothetical protein